MNTFRRLGILGLLLAGASIGTLLSQAPTAKRTVVERADVSVPGREAVIVRVEFPPGTNVGRHTHFGEEISYVIEGEGELLIDGQPPRKLKAGDGFVVPNGAKHDARNTGAGVLKISAVFVVEKGKPLATPAP